MGLFHTQKEPAAASHVKIASLRSKCNLSNWMAAARVHNRQVGEAIGSTGSGRKDPKRLRLLIIAEVAAALTAGLGRDPNQHTIGGSCWRPHHLQSVGYRSTAAVNNVASNLFGGPGILRSSAVWAGLRNLRVLYLHHGCQRSQVRGDGYSSLRNFKCVELQREFRSASVLCLDYVEYMADCFGASPDPLT